MTKSPQPYLTHIRQTLAQINVYLPPDRATFLVHSMARDAILMRLREIGENLSQLRQVDEKTFVAAADDSWYKLIGLRNVISHGHHTSEREQIWQIVTEELPKFSATIETFASQ